MSEHLFLYGTLIPDRAPSEVAGLVRRFRHLGRGHVRGRLYDFGDYPGAVLDPSSETLVHGHLVELPPEQRIWDVLDRYEEFDPSNPTTSLFIRKKVKIMLADGRTREGWVYVYNRDPGDAPIVRSGKYPKSKVA